MAEHARLGLRANSSPPSASSITSHLRLQGTKFRDKCGASPVLTLFHLQLDSRILANVLTLFLKSLLQIGKKIRPHGFGGEGVLIGVQTATQNAQSHLLIQQSQDQL